MSEIFHIKDSQHGRSRADVCLRCQWKKKKVAKYVLMESWESLNSWNSLCIRKQIKVSFIHGTCEFSSLLTLTVSM